MGSSLLLSAGAPTAARAQAPAELVGELPLMPAIQLRMKLLRPVPLELWVRVRTSTKGRSDIAARAGGSGEQSAQAPVAVLHSGSVLPGMFLAHCDWMPDTLSSALLSTRFARESAPATQLPFAQDFASDMAAASAEFCSWRFSASSWPTSSDRASMPSSTPKASSTPTIVATAPRSRIGRMTTR